MKTDKIIERLKTEQKRIEQRIDALFSSYGKA